MAKHRARKAGRPRKSGPRKPSGQLRWQAPGPNETVIQRRKALLGAETGLERADNPLDLAHARGWLTERQHRAGMAFARLHRSAGLCSPGLSYAGLPEVDAGTRKDVRTWNQLSDQEITEVWTQVMGRGGMSIDHESAQSMEKWVAVCAILSSIQLREVELVCINQSWPLWITQRCSAQPGTDFASTDWALLSGSFEKRRGTLCAGLDVIAELLVKRQADSSARAHEPISFGEMNSVPPPVRIIEETEIRVDEEGRQLLEVVRRKRAV